jgi:hypothetical protein
MLRSRDWLASLMLRVTESIRSFRKVPVSGGFDELSYRALLCDQKVRAQVEEGLWLELNSRTGQNYRTGENEKILQAVVAERLWPGDVFYGLGANIGTQEPRERTSSSE